MFHKVNKGAAGGRRRCAIALTQLLHYSACIEICFPSMPGNSHIPWGGL
ncbi:MAG: hypothetical protein KME31_35660 [Tolypothrix carrinoi HA7290-LM1]|nr:hypothetical protein [Tolypothrix carrinoi HA7290-LM1]